MIFESNHVIVTNFKTTMNERKSRYYSEPDQKELLNEAWYKAQHLQGRDSAILANLSTQNIEAINKAIASIQSLAKNLQTFRDCLTDAINLEAESADMAAKYSNENIKYQNAYQLPGVVTTPRSYDIEAIKKDSDRMTEINSERAKVTNQKETYLKICKEDVRVFISAWKLVNYQNAYWNEFIMSLNNSLNQNY